MSDYRKFSELLCLSRYCVVLTGAGISVESGIPDFRSRGGLWERYDPSQYAYIESFRANPGKVWKMLAEMDALFSSVRPNMAHIVLSRLESLGIVQVVVTQNIDSLHQRAGSSNVVEFHGHFRSLHCDRCGRGVSRRQTVLDSLPPLCSCGGALRPDIVFFGEEIPPDAYSQALEAARKCDLMLVVGTSASVVPASQLPKLAKREGARVLEINTTDTALSGVVAEATIMEPAGRALEAILGLVLEKRSFSSEES